MPKNNLQQIRSFSGEYARKISFRAIKEKSFSEQVQGKLLGASIEGQVRQILSCLLESDSPHKNKDAAATLISNLIESEVDAEVSAARNYFIPKYGENLWYEVSPGKFISEDGSYKFWNKYWVSNWSNTPEYGDQ